MKIKIENYQLGGNAKIELVSETTVETFRLGQLSKIVASSSFETGTSIGFGLDIRVEDIVKHLLK